MAMNQLLRARLRATLPLSQVKKSKLFSTSSNISKPERFPGTSGNNYNYDDVIKDFRWKIPEFWNFAQVGSFPYYLAL